MLEISHPLVLSWAAINNLLIIVELKRRRSLALMILPLRKGRCSSVTMLMTVRITHPTRRPSSGRGLGPMDRIMHPTMLVVKIRIPSRRVLVYIVVLPFMGHIRCVLTHM